MQAIYLNWNNLDYILVATVAKTHLGTIMKSAIVLSLFLTGCIVVESEKQPEWGPWDTATDTESYDTSSDTADPTVEDNINDQGFYVLPNVIAPGDRLIANLRSIETVSWGEISNITPYGALTICNLQPLYDEILLTIEVLDTVEEGTVDLVIEYIDGDVDLVEDAFTIQLGADIGTAEFNGDCQ